ITPARCWKRSSEPASDRTGIERRLPGSRTGGMIGNVRGGTDTEQKALAARPPAAPPAAAPVHVRTTLPLRTPTCYTRTAPVFLGWGPAPVAQGIERLRPKEGVSGSNPFGGVCYVPFPLL